MLCSVLPGENTPCCVWIVFPQQRSWPSLCSWLLQWRPGTLSLLPHPRTSGTSAKSARGFGICSLCPVNCLLFSFYTARPHSAGVSLQLQSIASTKQVEYYFLKKEAAMLQIKKANSRLVCIYICESFCCHQLFFFQGRKKVLGGPSSPWPWNKLRSEASDRTVTQFRVTDGLSHTLGRSLLTGPSCCYISISCSFITTSCDLHSMH